jgi:hypothetical protein
MMIEFYKTDLGLVVKDNNSIRLKSTYKKRILTEEEFNNSNPVRIKKDKYLEELNKFFNNSKHEWVYNNTEFKRLDNFKENDDFKNIPRHEIDNNYRYIIVMYHDRIYYTFFSGNYYPQMQLIDFNTKKSTNKWTNIRNLAPVFNKNTKTII